MKCFQVLPALIMAAAASAQALDQQPVDFAREVRPLLSDNCFNCHGPDPESRKGGLRLDGRDFALSPAKSGEVAIIPGKPEESELLLRISSSDKDEMMPPPGEHKKLKPEQVDILRRWIKEGANFSGHWAFEPVRAAKIPPVKDPTWPKNEVDRFVLARLEREGLRPSPEEDKARLLRRLSLDLTGLPPTPAEVDAFLADTSPEAYEKAVDRLMASPHFGERLALPWLDLARFADTAGYHNDSLRDMWLWREWVIDAFNKNKPFDQFTIEQLAGDLLPDATQDQKIASGFHRNVMTSDEGGIIEQEYLNLYVVDRVNTTGVTWLGLTVGCAQCHDHKYDPITAKDYYQLYAFFHNVPEKGKDGVRDRNPAPHMMVLRTDEEKATWQKALDDEAQAQKDVNSLNSGLDAAFQKWLSEEAAREKPAEPAGVVGRFPLDADANGTDGAGKPIVARLAGSGQFPGDGRLGGCFRFDPNASIEADNVFAFEKNEAFSVSSWVRLKAGGSGHIFGKLDAPAGYRGWRVESQDRRLNIQLISGWDKDAVEVRTKAQLPPDQWQHVLLAYDGSGKAAGVKLFINGREEELEKKKDNLKGTIVTAAPFRIGGNGSQITARVDDLRIYSRALAQTDAVALIALSNRVLLDIPADKKTAQQTNELKASFRAISYPELGDAEQRLAAARETKKRLEKELPNTMVMAEMEKPRDTFIKVRGAYDKDGDKVAAGVPAFLPAAPPREDGKPLNRLDLAKWLVAKEHPLTARVAVNRWWAMLFGTGIVKTVNDFGNQGEWPSHPELLDWLAADFMKDWDVKRVLKQMVMSAAYRQASAVSKELLERDTENRLLARGPRFRLEAEHVRDNALAISGLLNPQLGGKSFRPPQPPMIWESNDMTSDGKPVKYERTTGPEQYRRGIYVYIRRSTPYPTFITFDSTNREVCTASRPRTNTPLQSLALMNDPVFVEAARGLAQRVLKEVGSDADARIEHAWRLALARPLTDRERTILSKTLELQLQTYRQDPEAAKKLVSIGDLPTPEGTDISELAAWTALGNVILNLNETITN
jgi:mono/diheme cytochrome c family protein